MRNLIKSCALALAIVISATVAGCGGSGSDEPFAIRLKDGYPSQISSNEVLIIIESNKELAIVPGGFVRGTIAVTNASKPARFYAEVLGPNRDSVRLHFFGEKSASYTIRFDLIDVFGETKYLYVTFDSP